MSASISVYVATNTVIHQILLPSVLLSVSALPLPQEVVLVSSLPPDPIEPPPTWAWGEHPNGLGYKAKNGLSVAQCLVSPQLASSVLCRNAEVTVFDCANNPPVQKTALCEKFSSFF